jgi:hypothetical protein
MSGGYIPEKIHSLIPILHHKHIPPLIQIYSQRNLKKKKKKKGKVYVIRDLVFPKKEFCVDIPSNFMLVHFWVFVHLRESLAIQPGWPRTQDLPASASQVLGLQACTTTPDLTSDEI